MLSCLHFLLEMLKGHWGNCKCASCNENCTDNVILCDGKGVQWLHYNCGGLTEEQFEITNMLKKQHSYSFCFISWAGSYPLLGCNRSSGKCWAIIGLSCHPELSGHVLYVEVNVLDSEGQHGQW